MEHTLNYNDVLLQYEKYQDAARKILNPSCRVCKVCNGIACSGRFTNVLEFGSKGNNLGFINAYKALADIRIELDVIHEDYTPDTFGMIPHRGQSQARPVRQPKQIPFLIAQGLAEVSKVRCRVGARIGGEIDTLAR